jgi:UPF0716 family protein affecting phage T7 exclusion
MAAEVIPGLAPANKGTMLVAGDVLVIVGVVTALALLLLLAVYAAKRSKKRHKTRSKQPAILGNSAQHEAAEAARAGAGAEEERAEDAPARARRRYRKRKHGHRPRNPTLAETGGLPPARDPAPPAA